MNFKKWVTRVQTAGYNGVHTVLKFCLSFLRGSVGVFYWGFCYGFLLGALLRVLQGGFLEFCWGSAGGFAKGLGILLGSFYGRIS